MQYDWIIQYITGASWQIKYYVIWFITSMNSENFIFLFFVVFSFQVEKKCLHVWMYNK